MMSIERTIPSPAVSDGTGEHASVKLIRDAALEIIAAHGTEAASLRMVAKAAGVSLGSVQHHFGTKANLIQAVDDHVMLVLTVSLRGPWRQRRATSSPTLQTA
jgi:AcrR family transcriptional regulator